MPARPNASESTSTAILIKAYGEFWNPNLVNWNNTWRLLGADSRGRAIDAYEQRGIYVLYENYVPVYVGKADKQSIGYRLQMQRESQRKGPRWDRFSWFGITRINKNGTLGKLSPKVRASSSELIATLEALLILVIDPRLNARKEKFKNAVRLYQSDEDRAISESDRRLASIEQKLDSILKSGSPR